MAAMFPLYGHDALSAFECLAGAMYLVQLLLMPKQWLTENPTIASGDMEVSMCIFLGVPCFFSPQPHSSFGISGK